MQALNGIIPVLPTPFHDNDTIDSGTLRQHIDMLCGSGVHAIVSLGSTSEAPSLSRAEFSTVAAATIDQVAGRLPVFVGVSAASTSASIEMASEADGLGATGVMLTAPLYWHPLVSETLGHILAVAESPGLPVIVYNNPTATGVDLAPSDLIELSRHPNVAYVKESSGDPSRVPILVSETEAITVLCGSDQHVLDALLCGAKGWVSGAVNAFPHRAVELFELLVRDHDYDAAVSIYSDLAPLLRHLEASGQYVALVKAALAETRAMSSRVRLPLLPVESDGLLLLRQLLEHAAPMRASA